MRPVFSVIILNLGSWFGSSIPIQRCIQLRQRMLQMGFDSSCGIFFTRKKKETCEEEPVGQSRYKKSNPKDKKLLVVMAKEPVPGKVKTRLAGRLSFQQTAELYLCFLKDRLQEMSTIAKIDTAVAYSPTTARHIFASLTPADYDLFPQQNVSLGKRMQIIFADKFADNYDAVAIMDSDSPDLPRSIVKQCFQLLEKDDTDIVLGPCTDGGYYLIAMKKPQPELLDNIPWSTEKVLAATLEKAETKKIKSALLPLWNDIDTYQDLVLFYKKQQKLTACERGPGKVTFEYLSRLQDFPALYHPGP